MSAALLEIDKVTACYGRLPVLHGVSLDIKLGESVVEAILAIVRSGRPDSTTIDEVRRHVAWGPGPRASQALMLAARARAVTYTVVGRRAQVVFSQPSEAGGGEALARSYAGAEGFWSYL